MGVRTTSFEPTHAKGLSNEFKCYANFESDFTLQGTNTYLVGKGTHRLLIDTGEGKPSWLQSIQQTLSSEGAVVDKVILTHWHPDHVGGLPDLLRVCPDIRVHKCEPGSDQLPVQHGDRFAVEGATLRAFHSPGHTTDHVALILEEEDAMFTGDNVLGHGTGVFEDLSTYLTSLERMRHEFTGRAYPGHGAVIEDGPSKIVEYIQHRRQREDQVLEVLRNTNVRRDAADWGSMEIVRIVYKDVPEQLHIPAEGGVLQVLRKLRDEGRVLENEAGTWCINDKAAL
ncbi:MAG: hypothetical protein M1817_004199 [Caeruleum heppii]|nr:MAG: hypothetical protein M1817_004199 [Caeruleum heppii]